VAYWKICRIRIEFDMKTLALLLILLSPVFLYGQLHLELTLEDKNLSYSEIVAKFEQKLSTRSESQAKVDEKHFRRWQIAMEPHIGPDEKFTNYVARNWEAARKSKLMQNAAQFRGSTNGNWEDVTPTQFSVSHPNNGRINVIAVHPTDPNTIFIGAAVGGLWKTSDGGTTWESLTDGLPVIGVSGIVIHPDNPNIMYILTGDADGRYIPSIGVLKSFDGGYTWRVTALKFSATSLFYGYKIIMKPDDPDDMFVVGTNGIIRTTNGWDSFFYVLNTVSCRDIEFKPGDSNTIYASTAKTVYRSLSGGPLGSWQDLGPLNIGLPDTSSMTRVALAVTAADSDKVYALYAFDGAPDGNGYQGLYISNNNGVSWNANTDTTNIVGDIDRNQTGYDLVVQVDPQDAAHVLVGGVFVYQSTSTGVSGSWVNTTTGLHVDIHDFQYSGSTLYAASDGGIAKSTDGGQTWINISDGLNVLQFYDIDVLNNKLIGGTQDNGTSLWSLGDVEAQRVIGADGFEVIFDPSNTNVVYGCTQEVREKSTDSGSGGSFFVIHPPGHGDPWDASWIMHPTDYDTLYSGFDNIARSYDAGVTWDTMANPGLTTGGAIRAMAQGIDDPNVMYVSNRRQLFRTDNIHATIPVWTELTSFVPASEGGVFPPWRQLGGIAVDPEDVNKVWITFRNYTNGKKVYYSASGGADSTWVNISGSLPNVPVYTIVNQPGTADGLYIATDLGIFFRRTFFSDWLYFSNGMPTTRVEDLRISGSYLYAGTFGRGLWRSPLYFTCPGSVFLTAANDPSSPNSTGTQVYNAAFLIQSTRVITGGIGTDVSYTAGEEVVLSPGFHVKSFSTLEVKIGACAN
jgi:photosystem II stability/assembly factor-like uncharacterized protein